MQDNLKSNKGKAFNGFKNTLTSLNHFKNDRIVIGDSSILGEQMNENEKQAIVKKQS